MNEPHMGSCAVDIIVMIEPHRLGCSRNYNPCRWSCAVNEPHMGSCAVDIIVMSLIGWAVVEIIVLVGGAVL